MNVEIIPKTGVGDLRFGMSRDDARKILGGPYVSFSRSNNGTNETESFDRLGIQLSFTPDDQLEFIELSSPSEPTIKGLRLLGRNAREVQRELASNGIWGQTDDVGYDFRDWGFGLYAPGEVVEAVSIYRSGYYDTSPQEVSDRSSP